MEKLRTKKAVDALFKVINKFLDWDLNTEILSGTWLLGAGKVPKSSCHVYTQLQYTESQASFFLITRRLHDVVDSTICATQRHKLK